MAQSFLGSGDLYIDRMTDAGALTGFKIAGACSKFALNPESEMKEQIGKGRTNYGQVIASATLPGKTNISLTINQLDAENLALAFLGDVSAYSQEAVTTTATANVVAIYDRWVDIGKEALTDVVVKDATDTTTYTLDTDYSLNVRLGKIKLLNQALDGDTLHVSYKASAVSASKIVGGTSPIIRCRLELDGKNYVDGSNYKVIVYSARLKPNTEVDFLSDDFLPLELTGLCEIPEGKDEPFEIIYY